MQALKDLGFIYQPSTSTSKVDHVALANASRSPDEDGEPFKSDPDKGGLEKMHLGHRKRTVAAGSPKHGKDGANSSGRRQYSPGKRGDYGGANSPKASMDAETTIGKWKADSRQEEERIHLSQQSLPDLPLKKQNESRSTNFEYAKTGKE